jgi:DNA-binding response OmpR family regulator/signal transduction histidine kinase
VKENPDELRQRVAVLEERLSGLHAAVMRVSASLDLGTVLQEVVDSARVLTGARYGVILTEDGTGRIQDLVTSGFTPEEQEEIVSWSDGPKLAAHFRDLEGPLRLANLPEYVRELGLSAHLMRSKTLQCTPMLHRDAYVGSFFLAEKEAGHEFTKSDEEVLVLFASQAATAIANARAHRDEQRARADLEALVEMSPVGVVVFEGTTGKLVSFNREVRRIVESLNPGGSLEELLEVTTCRRADGTEIPLAEFPLARLLSDADTIRAEEITVSAPDGRSVSTLLNATPIRSRDGAVQSLIVTLQDLEPLEDVERLRAEFLSMVSHELRAPLISIKGSTATVLGAAPAPDPAEMLQFFRVIDDQANQMRSLIADLLDQGRIAAGTLSVSVEPAEVAGLLDQARSTFSLAGSGRAVTIDLPDDLPLVLADPGRIAQVLNNLLSNAALHSSDLSSIAVAASLEDDYVAISVTDRGSGVPPEKLPHLFRKHPGATGEKGVGYGLGLAICKGLVEAHGGRIWAARGDDGHGTRFTFTVPVAAETSGAAPSRISHQPRSTKPNRGTPILVVDDDPQTLRRVRDVLAEAGYAPILTGDPDELPGLIRTHRPRLVLLDLVLPGTDGLELMENVPELEDLPVIFISVYGRDETIARVLDAGAADYIVKPFSPSELTARVRAALRRQAGPKPFRLGDLSIRYEEREVVVDGRPVALTVTEFEVLRVLSTSAGRVVTYGSLLRQAWRRRDRGTGDPKIVRAMVKSLRRKLGDDAANPAYVLNERGVGYRMPRP